MKAIRTIVFPAAALTLAMATAACGGAEPEAASEPVAATAPAGDTAHPHHGMGGMQMDHATMQRHMQEGDSMAAVMRAHVQRMRGLSPEQQHARIGEHVSQLSRMLGMMDRHMREMGHGHAMDDAGMQEMMGMSMAEHERMMGEMRTLRAEAERLQTASQAEVRQLMPGHLGRLEGMLEMMDHHHAAHREMHGHGQGQDQHDH
jgi:hypothetical protein